MKKKASLEFLWSGESKRVQSLNGGKWVRVFDHRGKSHHIKVGDGNLPELVNEIAKGDENCAHRISVQLDALVPGWNSESEDQTDEAQAG